MKRTTFAVAAFAVVAIAVASSVAMVELSHEGSHGNRFHTSWKDVYTAPEPMIEDVHGVVVARHIGTSPGRVAFSSDPGDALPFELNHFVVERGLKGFKAGDSLTVERVGGDRNGERVILDADGGPYVPGQTYVLFVKAQEESEFFYLVNDEGRYSIDATERLVPVRDGGRVSSQLAGMTVSAFAAEVRGALDRKVR